ncbi:MAG: hypothetical protein CL842_03320 [Crocinitomicaceae bacterium]|nr:hypothetical protein [Crocinitomicaceae bacterium]|tara:strand:+ start:57789 stop:58598 length:810 start_codon:yes stop_codon:yes gene_type:complete
MKEEISLGELIVICLRFTKKNIFLFVIAAAIGVAIGYFKESKVIPTHKSEAVICSDIIDGQRLQDIISDLESATKNGNYAYLSNALNISKDSASSISYFNIEVIESETPYRSDLDMTKIKTHQCIKVTCSAKAPGVFAAVENAILSILSNHSEVKSIVDFRKDSYSKNIKKIKEDIEYLSDQRRKVYDKLVNGSGTDINQFDNQGQFIFAYQKITDLEELSLRTKAAVLMKPFNTSTVARHSKTKGITVMVILFLALAFAVAVFREIKL